MWDKLKRQTRTHFLFLSTYQYPAIMFSTTLFLAVLPLLQVCSGAITCLPIGRTATATWKTDAGQTCTWTGVVGSNFGFNSIGSE